MNCRDTLSSTGKFELGMENTVDKTTYCTEWDKGSGVGGGGGVSKLEYADTWNLPWNLQSSISAIF